MMHPRCWLNVETIRLPFPKNGVPGGVGSETRVVVLVGSCWPLFGGYLTCIAGQRECWPSDRISALSKPEISEIELIGPTYLEPQV